ncbi:ATP-binding cassette domain-containing protein [Gloeocapsa sp. PCC 7428]|uniref:ATP-binding cassette domain-containing protein n=1 Tax=Gloeocapsa sp. PCC 7428 TaxID=1173026 RepID=UPI0002F14951|nr:ATP-binding cassette domain-containing protein [Gloeocapsa sp. PCC 7428]
MKSTSYQTQHYEQIFNRNGFLEVENLVKSYPTSDGGEFVVLDGINLTINEDEFISVIGHSGCGKSTLLKIVAGLEKPTYGSVRLDGREIRKPGAKFATMHSTS